MAKIDRYTGNYEPFGANSQGTERTIFEAPGATDTQSDTLDANINTDYLRGWGDNVVGPSQHPTRQQFNAGMFTLGQTLAYLHQEGIPDWDPNQEYNIGSACKKNGQVFFSNTDQTGAGVGNDPESDNINWSSESQKYQPTIASAKLSSPSIGAQIVTSGYLSEGDGGGGVYLVVSPQAVDGYGDHLASNGNALILQKGDTVCVKQFGAVGDGVVDDTAAFQAALESMADSKGQLVGHADDIYSLSSVRIKNGLRLFDFTMSTIKGQGASVNAVVELDGPNKFAGALVQRCTVSARFDMSAGDRTAIFADESADCVFEKNTIAGFTDHPTLNHYGILFWYGSRRNVVQNNNITGVIDPTQRGLLIDFVSNINDFADYFNGGNITLPTKPCSRNIVQGNVLTGGSYAVNMLGCDNTIVSGNTCDNNNHRAIYMAAGCVYNVISDNTLREYLSSGVLAGYGSSNNIITNNNIIRSVYNAGEAAININTGSKYNLIADNVIDAGANYGVYLALDSIGNVVQGNDIKNFYQAGIALENDWVASNPANAFYSRPNFGAPPVGVVWAFNNSEENVIQGNVIREAYQGRDVAAIYISEIDGGSGTSTINNIVKNNSVTTSNRVAYNLFLYENTPGRLLDIQAQNNLFNKGNDSAPYGPSGIISWHSPVSFYGGNRQLDEKINAEAQLFALGDTTPSVLSNADVSLEKLFQLQNTSATSVTNFDDGVDSQVITIRLDSFTTIAYNSGLIRTKGLVDIAPSSSNNYVSFRRISGVWFEQWRSF